MSEGTPFIPPLPSTPQQMAARTPFASDSRGLPPQNGHLRAPWEGQHPGNYPAYQHRTPNPTSAAGTPWLPPTSPPGSGSSGSSTRHSQLPEDLSNDPNYINAAPSGNPPLWVFRGNGVSSDFGITEVPPSPTSSSTTRPSQRGQAAPPPVQPPQNPYASYPSPYMAHPYAAPTPFTSPYAQTQQGPWPAPPASSYTPWGPPPGTIPTSPWAQAPPPTAFTPQSPWAQPQYTPFAPPQATPWGAQPPPQATPWGPPQQQLPPGPWAQWGPQAPPGWGAPPPPPPPPPIAVERDFGRPLAKANQPPVGDRIDKWAEGSHYGPVLMSAEAHILGVTFEINPLLSPPTDTSEEYLKWDMIFQTSYCQLTTDPSHVSWQKGRGQPATFPRVHSLRLVSKTLPYIIDIHTSHSEIGVTCGDVIEALGNHLHQKASREEYESRLPKARQQEVAMSYHRNRSREPDVPGGRLSSGLLKLDVLGKYSIFGGIKQDKDAVIAICGTEMPSTFELVCGRKLASSEQEIIDAQARADAQRSLTPAIAASRSTSRNSTNSHSRRKSRVETVSDEDASRA